MPSAPTPPAVSEYLSAIGREGGKVKGETKNRGGETKEERKAYYSNLSRKGNRAKKRKAKELYAKAVKDYEAEHGKPKHHAR